MDFGDTRPGKGDHEIAMWISGGRTTEPRRAAGYIVRRTTQFPLYREDRLKSWIWARKNFVEKLEEVTR